MSAKSRRLFPLWVLWLFTAPIALFVLLIVLLYVPPVQNFAVTEASRLVSQSVDYDISIGRIDLRFPLNLVVRNVNVVRPAQPDGTDSVEVLSIGTINVQVQAAPLLHNRVEVDKVQIDSIRLNSVDLVDGMSIKGAVDHFMLASHGVDISGEVVTLNDVLLSGGTVDIAMTPVADDDTEESSDVDWVIKLDRVTADNLHVNFSMPQDTMSVEARITRADLVSGTVDLGRSLYSCDSFTLDAPSLYYDSSAGAAADGFDPSHIALHAVSLEADSLLYHDRDIRASLRQLSLYDRSGLTLTSLTGRVLSDANGIDLSSICMLTPNSEALLSAQLPWALVDGDNNAQGDMSVNLDVNIGREDVFLMVGDSLASMLRNHYPSRPLIVNTALQGTLQRMDISRLKADLPGAVALEGTGHFGNLLDSIARSAEVQLQAQTYDLNFLLGLAGMAADSTVVIPDSMSVQGSLRMAEQKLSANLDLSEEQGAVYVGGTYGMDDESYDLMLRIDSLRLDHFLPNDSIYNLAGTVQAHGRGLDYTSSASVFDFSASVDQIQYKNMDLSGIRASGNLAAGLLSAVLDIDNALVKAHGNASMRTNTRNMEGSANIGLQRIDLYSLGLLPSPLNDDMSMTIDFMAAKDSAQIDIRGGDMDLRLRSLTSLEELMASGGTFDKVMLAQLESRHLDHAALRRALPSAGFRLRAGQNNPLSSYLRRQNIRFHDILVNYGVTPDIGINGKAEINGLQVDSLQLDTVYLYISQDTSRMDINGGVVNGKDNPQYVFNASLNGEIRTDDAQLDLKVLDAKGDTGILVGVNMRPLINGGPRQRANGLVFRITPDEPVIAFRKFGFDDGRNTLYLHSDNRAYANIDMDSDDGLCLRLQSDMTDTVSLQNMNLELSRFKLSELSGIIPYMPKLTGLLNLDAAFIQTATSMQLSSEAMIDELTYEKQRVGNLGLGFTWLPGTADENFIDAYLSYDDEEVVTSSGVVQGSNMNLDTSLEHTPLRMFDAFMPGNMVNFLGSLHGDVAVTGTMDKPQINGQVHMDSVYIISSQAGAEYRLDNRPVQIADNKLRFDKFAIYTTSENPFTIDGIVDFTDVTSPTANLTLLAENYTLLDAPKTRESLLFGRILVDINATVRGPVSSLTMRGQMNVLGDTNATYVMANSPLVVEDRLEGLVSFVSFDEVDSQRNAEETTMSLGGMDMIMTVHIDDAVRMRANLTSDGDKYVELVGGGDLSMTYTPQGDMTLTGRYTLTGGTMKYSLPVIPLKEFTFTNGSYVEWRGDMMNPRLNLTASERVRASVSDGSDDNSTRRVDFDVSISIKDQLSSPELTFDLSAPNDGNIENELQTMGTDSRSKAAITMLATGMYLGGTSSAGNMNMGTALNSVLQSQINSLAGSVSNSSFSVGIEDRSTDTGSTQTDYTFRYSQRFFNDRVQINIGGKVSTGSNASNNVESFIDNVSLEYRLDASGTRYVRAFHDKNYENILEGEVTETGVGIVFRKKMDSLSELFLFRKKKSSDSGNDTVTLVEQ